MKIFSVAILGCGNRGADSYGEYMFAAKDKFKISVLCDLKEEVLEKYGKKFGVSKENLFNDENTFFAKKRADAIVIATQDKDHVRHCLKAMELGYDILLEKPITDKIEECEQLLAAHTKYGSKILVCHVLRYAPAFVKVAALLNEGAIGRLVAIQALEQVSYWHQAHSYVRGNWRIAEETTPMILAKCCHDLDLLQYYAKSKCKSISSVGDLTYFNENNAPQNTASRCADCRLVDSCPYSAKRIYIDEWKAQGCPEYWPFSVLASGHKRVTEEILKDAVKNGPYGRCVFRCDNDVVDHQITQMTFENGVKATLTMTAFTKNGGRIMSFFGTLGEIVLNEELGTIEIKPFGAETVTVNIKDMKEAGHAHGGGDKILVSSFYDTLCGFGNNTTTID
ncbi:MAG: Gfo/Idh/MocA family oxidoreductase, partial [Muribaculaceae bacterium]|nr:Gfo/Idh/MocA family oxidoreductase [Muribaculaceae bacterium]